LILLSFRTIEGDRGWLVIARPGTSAKPALHHKKNKGKAVTNRKLGENSQERCKTLTVTKKHSHNTTNQALSELPT